LVLSIGPEVSFSQPVTLSTEGTLTSCLPGSSMRKITAEPVKSGEMSTFDVHRKPES
jgi:hypothetical protein